MDYNITKEEFNRRVNENVETLKRQIEQNRFCANDYHFLDHPKEDNHFFVSRRFFDILAATVIGALPLDEISGVDCYRHCDKNGFIPTEVKLVELHTRNIFRSSKTGSLYYAKTPTKCNNRRSGIRSKFRASYEIYNNLKSKNMRTVLVLFDTERHKFVDALEMDGNKVIHLLENKFDGAGNIIGKKKSIKRTITLSAFLSHSEQAKTMVPIEGYHKWEERLKLCNKMPLI